MRIADAVVTAYLAESRRSGAQRLEEARREITLGLPALQSDLRSRERQIDEAKRRLQAVGGSQGDVDEQQLKEATSELVSARSKTLALRIRADQLARLSRTGGSLDGEDFSESPALEALRLQAASLGRQEGAAGAKFGPRHPSTVALAQQRHRFELLLREELARTAGSIQNELVEVRTAENLLYARVEALKQKNLAASQARVELRQLERVAEADGPVLEASLRRATELDQGSAAAAANVRVLDPAGTPRGPATPRLALVAVAALAGLTTGAAILTIRSRPLDHATDSIYEPRRALLA
jgi:uncharacterized protein involved in exopolysaccharide biosynthesis